MRYVLAIASLVLAGVMLLLGIGQRTFLAEPTEVTIAIDTQSEAGFGVIDAAELTKFPGQVNIVVRDEHAFVATGATRDVDAWVEPYLHAQMTVDVGKQRMLSALVAPAVVDADENVENRDPRGSDLWLSERGLSEASSSEETATLRVPVVPADGQSILIASNGTDPMPADLSIMWVQDLNTPWAGPLLAGGAVFAVLGGVLYLLAMDHDRRGLGPRRGRRGPLQGFRNAFARSQKGSAAAPATHTGPQDSSGAPDQTGERAMKATESRVSRVSRGQRRRALPVVGLALALGLSGCSASYWPSLGADSEVSDPEAPGSSAAPVPVTEGQLDRILADVVAVANAADDSLNADELDARFSGDALAQRAANYKIRQELPDYNVVPPRLTSDELGYELVQSTESWPRTMFVTVASTSATAAAEEAPAAEETPAEDGAADGTAGATETPASPSLALMLTQEDPHANYEVSRVIALRGGISMPQAAPAEEGTALLANDIGTLVLEPGKVGEAYAALLQNGTGVPEAEFFDLDTDTLLENYGLARAQTAQQQSDEKGQTMKFSVTARQGDEPVIALSTGAGGALVATTVIEEQIVNADGGRYKPQAQDAVTALSGLTGEQESIVQEVAHQMLFFVPSASDGAQIQLLGVTSELVGVRN